MKKLLAPFALLLTASLHAAPSVSGVTGAAVYGSTLSVFGTGFGTKPIREKQTLYANFKSNINPSTWSYVTSWSDKANFEWKSTNCDEGSGCGGETSGWDATSSPNKVTAAINHGELAASGKFFVSWMWKSDAPAVSDLTNLKTYRWWPASVGNKNNLYGGQQCDGGFVNFTEETEGNVVSGVDRIYSNDIEPIGSAYKQVEMLYQLNSSAGAQNGVITILQNGSADVNTNTWRSNTAGDSGNGRYAIFYPVHMEFTTGNGCGVTPPIGSGHFVRYDNIAADTSWCSVWVTVNSTNGAGGTKYWLPVISWAGGTIQVAWACDKFSAGSTVYLYVRENGGTVNSAGFPVTVSGSVVAPNPAPTVTSLSTTSGPASGGTSTTITGAGFLTGCTVDFGGSAATSVVRNSATSITCNTPAHAAGAVTVTVSNTDGQTGAKSNGYTFVAAPTVTSVSANSGPVAGGISVTVNGTLFSTSITGVTFGGIAATSVVRVSATQITCVVPAHSAGAVNVVVTNSDGQTGTLTSGFTYNTAPSVSSVNPSSAPAAGAISTTITGSGFTSNASSVTIGGNLLTSVLRPNGTTITGSVPAHAAGTVDVIVSNSDAQTGTGTGLFTYIAAPTITSLNVVSGSTTGATAVSITGTGFSTSITSVKFGGTAATSVTRVSSTLITCLTPAHVAGTVSVVVTNSVFSQTATASNAYTFVDNVPSPALTALSVSTASVTGGVTNILTGSNFLTGAAVTFGSTPASAVSVLSATSIRCTVPAGSPGTVSVKVTNPDAQVGTLSDAFTYILSPPVVSSLSLTTSTCAGLVVTTITGTGFQSGPSVMVGTQTATSITFISSTSIRCTVPARNAGTVSVTVTNADGQSSTKANAFTYIAAPSITSISPTTGSTTGGGTIITLTGANFQSGAIAGIGVVTSLPTTFFSSTQLQVTAPALSASTYAVVLTNPDGQHTTLPSAYSTHIPAESAAPSRSRYHRVFLWIRGRL